MNQDNITAGELLEDVKLTLEQLASICKVQPAWVSERVEAGILLCESSSLTFASAELIRARRLVSIERDFDANQELAALVADLMEEIARLKTQLKLHDFKFRPRESWHE